MLPEFTMYHKIGSVLSGWMDKMSVGSMGALENDFEYRKRIEREAAAAKVAKAEADFRAANITEQDKVNAAAKANETMLMVLSLPDLGVWIQRYGSVEAYMGQVYADTYEKCIAERAAFYRLHGGGGGVVDPNVPDNSQTNQAYQDYLNQQKNTTDEGTQPAGITTVDNRNFFMKNLVWILGGVAALGAIIYIRRKRGK